MEQIASILNEIKSNSGRIAKEDLLKKYEDVEGLKEIFKFVYDPHITTGISKKKLSNPKGKRLLSNTTIVDDLNGLLSYLKENNTGRLWDLSTVHSFISNYDGEVYEMLESIVTKDLPIGLSRTTLNKVYGKDFIPKYSVMLSGKYEPGKIDSDSGFSVSLKLDGNRVTAFKYNDGTVKFFTRSGKLVEGLVDLEKKFEDLPSGYVYDGELIAQNPDKIHSKDLFNLTQTIVRKKGIKSGLNFIIFDLLPITEFNEGISKKVYKERLSDMNSILGNRHPDDIIQKVPIFYTGEDETKIPELLDWVESIGFEGLMINTLDGKYETKRTKSILKVKTFHTADLLCVGVKEDIRGGKCGSLTVQYKGYTVDVSGLKHELKEKFWNEPETVVGKIIEVKYFEESKNAQGGISLRFPNFVRIRDEKTVEDVSYA